MKRYQWIIPIIIIVFSAFTAYQWGVFPAVQKTDSSKFSAMRVAEDLKIISQHPHSIIHTEERIAVRDYLVHRLQEQGATPILYTYPNIKSRKYIFVIFGSQ